MTYRFLCCSDTHGAIPPVVDEAEAVAWLHAGDLCRGSEAADLFRDSDPRSDPILRPTATWFTDRKCPLYYVDGNHDVWDVYHAARWARNITGLLVPLSDDLYVAGLGWHGEFYFELPMEADLRVCCNSVLRMARRLLRATDKVILLTHYPPRIRGTHEVLNDVDGGGVWYDCVRDVMEQLNVIAVAQGHMHEWFGDARHVEVGQRTVLIANPGPRGGVLTIDGMDAHFTAFPP